MRSLIVVTLLVVCGTAAAAGVYRTVSPDGEVTFSDRPTPGSEAVKLPPVQTFQPPPLPAGAPAGSPAEEATKGYESFAVSAPQNDASIRDNTGNVSIQLAINPALRPDHTIDIIMNGQTIGNGRTLSITVRNMDRGTHTVEAAVRDQGGREVARTSPITFHLLRAAAGS